MERDRDRSLRLPESPAAERNKGPILAVLERVLPVSGTVLEIASGTGQHAVYFAAALPGLVFQPSEMEETSLDVLRARRDLAALPNLAPPFALDVREPSWPIVSAAAVLCINMIHIAPWSAAEGLLSGAARLLPAGGPLVLYGPFVRADVPTAPSNLAFDSSLKSRNPDWGIRHLGDVTTAARAHDLRFDELVEMPANNLIVVYRRG